MAVYTDITDAELEAFLADYEIGRATSFKGIAEGVENSNFLLETQTGRTIISRVPCSSSPGSPATAIPAPRRSPTARAGR